MSRTGGTGIRLPRPSQEIVAHESHRHVLIERLDVLCLLKLTLGEAFAQERWIGVASMYTVRPEDNALVATFPCSHHPRRGERSRRSSLGMTQSPERFNDEFLLAAAGRTNSTDSWIEVVEQILGEEGHSSGRVGSSQHPGR